MLSSEIICELGKTMQKLTRTSSNDSLLFKFVYCFQLSVMLYTLAQLLTICISYALYISTAVDYMYQLCSIN